MKNRLIKKFQQSTGLIIFFLLCGTSICSAQIREDGTTSTIVNFNQNTFTIDGGTKAGSNLFHSFLEFSVPTGNTAFFNNLAIIENIFVRVTGNSISSIDGLIKANNLANLFIINPKGIQFGANASLDIGGSFFASTADSIRFADGSTFSATNPESPPLLAINVPVGLQMGSNPGQISVEGNGHNIVFVPSSPYQKLDTSNDNRGLQVKSGQTLALIGGQINLEGGILIAPSGKIELGSVRGGEVNLSQTPQGWSFGYENVNNFQDIRLSQRALADASGLSGGSIHVRGENISLSDGSLLFIQHEGNQINPSISVRANGTLKLRGFISSPARSPDELKDQISSAIVNEALGTGEGARIEISAEQLILEQGGAIKTSTFGSGQSGDIIINVSESIKLIEPFADLSQSVISTETFSPGKAGDVTISTRYIQGVDGGAIGSQANSTGSSGNVNITASEAIDLIGVVPDTTLVTTISSATAGSGNAGSLTINTGRLSVQNGASIIVSTFAQGNAGTLTINASDSIQLNGISTDFINSSDDRSNSSTSTPSLLSSAALLLSPEFRAILGLPDQPTGVTGNIIVNTPKLTITNGAIITSSHQGSIGNAGSILINTNSLNLDRQGSIAATTVSGEGGNLAINVQDILSLRNNSSISTTAGGSGNGGNIDISARFIVTPPNQNNDITANAFGGNGGNITITTEGLLGITPRSQTTSLSDITASSDLGISGNIQINRPDYDPQNQLSQNPGRVEDPQLAEGCENPRLANSRFVITGRGGIMSAPSDPLSIHQIWEDISIPTLPDPDQRANTSTIVEAQGMIVDPQGKQILVSNAPVTLTKLRCQATHSGIEIKSESAKGS